MVHNWPPFDWPRKQQVEMISDYWKFIIETFVKKNKMYVYEELQDLIM